MIKVLRRPVESTQLTLVVDYGGRRSPGGVAIGTAVAGAVAGHPDDQARFLRGCHAVALGSACLYTAAAVLAVVLLPGGLVRRSW